MLTTIRQRIGSYFRKLVFLEGLPQPQSPRSSSAATPAGAERNGSRSDAAAIKPTGTASPANNSDAERAAFWANHAHLSRDEQLSEWEAGMDRWLAKLSAEEQAFLKRLLRENGQPVDTVTLSGNGLYRAFMTGEGASDIHFFARRVAENSPAQIDEHRQLIADLANMYGAETGKQAIPLIEAITKSNASRNGHACAQTPSFVLGTDIHSNEQVTISLEEQRLGQYIIGSTGTGKSTLLCSMILSAIRDNHGVCVVEPHEYLVRSVISGIPDHRLKDVILVSLTDSDAVGINLFECPQPRTINTIAAVSSFVSHVFEKVWGAGTETPRLMMVLRALTRTLIENSPEATFCEIPLLLQHEGIRQVMAKHITNSSIASFWESYNHRSQRDRDELTASTLNKVVSFLDQDLIRNIVGQSRTTLDFRKIMDEGKILLVSLSPQYEEASRLLGSVLIGRILMAAFSRADTPEENLRPFFLYCDEYQRFATSDFATLLAEARKFSIITILANQTLMQLDELNQAAALQCGNLTSFRVSGEDSKIVSKSYDATPGMEQIGLEPVRSPVADCISHLVNRGHNDERLSRFSMTFLAALEQYTRTPGRERHAASHNCHSGLLLLHDLDVQRGRTLLNDALFQAMSQGRADIPIDPMAILVLTIAQGTTMEYVLSPYVYTAPIELFGAHSLKGCGMLAPFGKPAFLANGAAEFVSAQRRKHRWMAEKFVAMLTDLRYVLTVLSEHPVLVDTGQYVPQYRQRSYQDQENLIANELSTLPRYTARVRLISGREHTIRTLPSPKQLCEGEIDERIAAIKQRMLFFDICKPYTKVQREIDLRQAMWRERADADIPPPPPLRTNGNGRRNGRQKSPARSSTGDQ